MLFVDVQLLPIGHDEIKGLIFFYLFVILRTNEKREFYCGCNKHDICCHGLLESFTHTSPYLLSDSEKHSHINLTCQLFPDYLDIRQQFCYSGFF